MSVDLTSKRRLAVAVAAAVALLSATPSGAQQPPQQRLQPQRIQPQRPQPQPQRAQPPRPQEAQRRRGGNGAGIAAGVIGGLAAGTLLGGALAGRGGPVEPGYAGDVEGGPGYGPGPGYGGCPLVRQPVYDGAGRFAGYQALPSC